MNNETNIENNQLPEDVKRAIKAVDVDSQLASISQKYNLHVDQAGALGIETYMVISSITDGAEFVDNVEKEVGVTEDVAIQIVTDINNQIFLKIRELLQNETNKTIVDHSMTIEDRQKTLDAIENPVPTKPTVSLTQTPERELVNRTTTDNFIAQKMSPDISTTQNTAPNPIRKDYTNDPYREPLK